MCREGGLRSGSDTVMGAYVASGFDCGGLPGKNVVRDRLRIPAHWAMSCGVEVQSSSVCVLSRLWMESCSASRRTGWAVVECGLG